MDQGARLSRGMVFFLATPIVACQLYGPECLRRISISAGAALLAGAWAWEAFRTKSVPWRGGLLGWLAVGFAALVVLQSFRALNFYSGVSRVSLYGAGVLLFLTLSSSADLRAAFLRQAQGWLLAASLVIPVAGILQWLGWASMACLATRLSHQPPSLFDNGNFGGTFAAMLLAPAFVGALRSSTTRLHLWRFALTLLMLYLLLTQSRGGMIAVVGAMIVFGIALFLRARKQNLERGRLAAAVAYAIAGIPLAFAMMNSGTSHGTTPTHWALHAVSTHSAGSRLQMWKSSLEMIRDNTLLGVGAGNFSAAYHRYREEAELEAASMRGWNVAVGESPVISVVGNPDNAYLHMLSELGPLGLGVFLALFCGSFLCFLRRVASDSSEEAWWGLGFAGSLTAFGIASGVNSLPLLAAHSIVAWGFAGLMSAQDSQASVCFRWGAAYGLAALFFLAASVLGLGQFWSRHLELRFDVTGSGDDLDRSMGFHPWDSAQRLRVAEIALKEKNWKRAIEEYTLVLGWEPEHPVAACGRGLALEGEGRIDEAMREFEAIARRNSRWPYGRTAIGRILYEKGNAEAAEKELAETLKFNPGWGPAMMFRGLALGSMGRVQDAVRQFSEAQQSGVDVARWLSGRPEPWLKSPEYASWRHP